MIFCGEFLHDMYKLQNGLHGDFSLPWMNLQGKPLEQGKPLHRMDGRPTVRKHSFTAHECDRFSMYMITFFDPDTGPDPHVQFGTRPC